MSSAPASSPTATGPQLLIAVTGEPGDGKTRLLAAIAAEHTERGERVEGVLSVAGTRPAEKMGALNYFVRIIGRPGEFLWATRDESRVPPYVFHPQAAQELCTWAEQLRDSPGPALLVIDEFGKFEARGEGLMPLWPAFAASRPAIAIFAVRQGLEDEIEQMLGRKFDVRIEARAPDALGRLQRACQDYGEWTRLGLFGGAAGGIEMSVGALLHSAKVPLRGLMMSSLQGAMMTFAGFGLSQPGRVVWVPFISAGLKALSPAGSRIRPMFAICIQGALYGTSVQVLGWNAVGVVTGGALIGLWSALQGVLLQYLLLGQDLVRAYDTAVLWLMERWNIAAPGILWVAGGWAALCGLVAAGTAGAAWRLRAPPSSLRDIIERETTGTKPADVSARRRSRWSEFAHWQFWLPLVLVSSVLLAGGRSLESVAWLIVRFVTVGFVVLTLISFFRPAALADALRRRGWWGPAVAFSGALARRQRRN